MLFHGDVGIFAEDGLHQLKLQQLLVWSMELSMIACPIWQPLENVSKRDSILFLAHRLIYKYDIHNLIFRSYTNIMIYILFVSDFDGES